MGIKFCKRWKYAKKDAFENQRERNSLELGDKPR